MTTKPHSAEYFGEQRDFWWNRDFLELMAKRLGLSEVRSVLDVGCGVGHWGRALMPVLSRDTTLVGVDREPEWVKKAQETADKITTRMNYKVGDALHLPFEDQSFDLVTCQTVLIHLKEPKVAIQEMLRVLRPGGKILVAEPNNFAGEASLSSLSMTLPTDRIIRQMRFKMICERGKAVLGLGYNSLGDLIPGYFSELGIGGIQVHISDKAGPLFPPYSGEEQQALIKQGKEWSLRDDFLGYSKQETETYFLAGGGTAEELALYWKEGKEDQREATRAIDECRYHAAGGGIVYLVSGIKE